MMNLIICLKRIKYRLAVRKNSLLYLCNYIKRWNKFSASELNDDYKYLRLRILVASHAIEKGFSHDDFKPGFGKDIVVGLFNNLRKYQLIGGNDKYAIELGYSLLNLYHEKNEMLGFDDSDYLPSFPYVNHNNKGYKEYILGKDSKFSSFEDFIRERASVRLFNFKSEEIKRDEILECVKIGQLAPNACNRQAVRVHITNNNEIIDNFERLQLGCKGFATNAGYLVIVTSDLELYESSEIRLPSIDAGLFIMNFINACQERNIYSCILNGAFPGNANNCIRNIMKIPDNEDIEACIVLYKINELIPIKVAESLRRTPDEICTFIE